MKKAALLGLFACVLLSSCSLTIKNDRSLATRASQTVSLTIAPLVSVKRVDVLPNGEQHTASFFAIAPIPEHDATTTTTTTQGSKTTVVEEKTTTDASQTPAPVVQCK